ncbi:pyruvate kinase [Tengunoibacter tsumagoiensis]|uniref:Pyruvate kinase n=1 Tax=Tengunoibacter tsumagoiensis TaxID=2014871 RepID=A0A401ZZM6_9CHLR|nr:pyruvate kinase [Tengunoibacter tsumagoiensis]GCE12327.1 pyruvate kinase [Tengunoibacter tsumagoiensis]
MRRTKIVCTIGPATDSEEKLEQLIRAGMNVARLNFSHGAQEHHAVVLQRIRAISKRLGVPVAILQDLQGPKIRVGKLKDAQPIPLVVNTRVIITTREIPGNEQIIPTTYKSLAQDVKEGDRILLDDGLMELRVLGFNETDVECLVVHGGRLKEHKGINLPGVAVSAPSLTEKDCDDLRFGVQHGVDYVALSFVRTPDDVLAAKQLIKQHLAELSAPPDKDIPLIAKIEKPEAIENLDDILEVVDGIMVARGDLGVEMAPEKVPLLQKHIISRCNALGLPVITATQMLESMVTNPRPTRAEVNDVANAVFDGTDAVMLSAETAAGAHPIEAVEMMVRIALETEAGDSTARQPQTQKRTQEHAISHAARALSEATNVNAIVVFTRSGASAHLISKDRPRTPIFAYTPSEEVYRRLALWWGVRPCLVPLTGTTDELIEVVDQLMLTDKLVEEGDKVVIMGGLPIASKARTNFVKLHCIADKD